MVQAMTSRDPRAAAAAQAAPAAPGGADDAAWLASVTDTSARLAQKLNALSFGGPPAARDAASALRFAYNLVNARDDPLEAWTR